MSNEPQKSGIDRNTIFALVLCAAIWFGWQNYLEKKYPEALHPTAPAVTGQNAAVTQNAESGGQGRGAVENKNAETKTSSPQSAPKGPENTWKYEDANWRVEVSSYGGRISEIALKKYEDHDGQPLLLTQKEAPGFLVTHLGDDGQGAATNFSIKPLSETKVELTGTESGKQIKKTLTIVPEKYIVDVDVEITGVHGDVKNVSFDVTAPAPGTPEVQGIGSAFSSLIQGVGSLGQKKNDGGDAQPKRLAFTQEYFFSYGTKTDRINSTEKDRPNKSFEQAHFAALGTHYFTTLFFNRGDVMPVAKAIPDGEFSLLRMTYPVLANSGPINARFSLYAGPKKVDLLQAVDESASQVMDLGRFSWIAVPILKLMKLLYELFKNWGVAIIALTILVRLVTYPFTYMSYKSMKAMQKIQPETVKIREKYKDNPTLMNQEVMRLWKENKVNPMGGCLPIVLQLPVFWALYTVLQNSIELYHAPFIFWIKDLSLKDPYYVTPVLMGITMFIQQKMTPSTADPAQARMMMIMPVFFALLMMNLPSGLTLYIFVSTLFGIIQQYFVMRDRRSTVTVIGAPVRGTSK